MTVVMDITTVTFVTEGGEAAIDQAAAAAGDKDVLDGLIKLDKTRVIDSDGATHLRYENLR
jgi:hypothetical protein